MVAQKELHERFPRHSGSETDHAQVGVAEFFLEISFLLAPRRRTNGRFGNYDLLFLHFFYSGLSRCILSMKQFVALSKVN